MPVYTVGDQTFAANPPEVAIGESTIRVRWRAVTVTWTPISLQSSGALVIVDSTVPVIADAVSEAAATQPASV